MRAWLLATLLLALPVAAAAPGDTVVEVQAWPSREGDPLGEEVVHVRLACGPEVPEPCVPTAYFVGAHLAPLGQDARVGSNSDWRSASASLTLVAAGHDAHASAGTFHAYGLRYGYVAARVDDRTLVDFFDGGPLP